MKSGCQEIAHAALFSWTACMRLSLPCVLVVTYFIGFLFNTYFGSAHCISTQFYFLPQQSGMCFLFGLLYDATNGFVYYLFRI